MTIDTWNLSSERTKNQTLNLTNKIEITKLTNKYGVFDARNVGF